MQPEDSLFPVDYGSKVQGFILQMAGAVVGSLAPGAG